MIDIMIISTSWCYC